MLQYGVTHPGGWGILSEQLAHANMDTTCKLYHWELMPTNKVYPMSQLQQIQPQVVT
jgi:hypothetical protein